MPEISDDDLGLLAWCALGYGRRLLSGRIPPQVWEALSTDGGARSTTGSRPPWTCSAPSSSEQMRLARRSGSDCQHPALGFREVPGDR